MPDQNIQDYIDRAIAKAEAGADVSPSHMRPMDIGGIDVSSRRRAAVSIARKIFDELAAEESERKPDQFLSQDLPPMELREPAAPAPEFSPPISYPENVIEFPRLYPEDPTQGYITESELQEMAPPPPPEYTPPQLPPTSPEERKLAAAMGMIPKFSAPQQGPSLPKPNKGVMKPLKPAFKPLPPPKLEKPKAQKSPYAPDAGTVDTTNKFGQVEMPNSPVVLGSRKEQDLKLWRAWKAAPSKMTLQPLMRAMTPVMKSEVSRWGSQVPRAALDMEAKKLTLEALKTYNPNANTALATHVMNRLKKLSRLVYANQDLVRLPENKKLKSQTFHNGFTYLAGEFGRDPTNEEIADHLGWSRKAVSDVQRATVGEYIESQDVGGEMFSDVVGGDATDFRLDYIYHSLDPISKLVFEHTTGYSGKKMLTTREVARKTGLTENQVTHRKRKIAQMIRQHT